MPLTVPVKVGLARSAFKFKDASTTVLTAFVSNAVDVAVEIGLLASEVLSTLPRPTIVASMPLTVPVKVGLAIGAFSAILFVIVVEKFASFPSAVANSFKVSNAAGALAIISLIRVCTNSVVATCVVFVALAAVGARGIPVKVGLARLAFKFKEASTYVNVGNVEVALVTNAVVAT
jgi:hypothetical protein